MKKTWIAPEVQAMSIADTMFDTKEGVRVDGTYIDSETCSYEDGYFYS